MAKAHNVHPAASSQCCGRSAGTPLSHRSRAVLRNVADSLHLAAAPAFAGMALLAGLDGGGSAAALCTTHGGSPVSGMALMYALMSAVHLAPWLQWASRPGEAN